MITHEIHQDFSNGFDVINEEISYIQDEIHDDYKEYSREYKAIDTVVRKIAVLKSTMEDRWIREHRWLRDGDPTALEQNPYKE